MNYTDRHGTYTKAQRNRKKGKKKKQNKKWGLEHKIDTILLHLTGSTVVPFTTMSFTVHFGSTQCTVLQQLIISVNANTATFHHSVPFT